MKFEITNEDLDPFEQGQVLLTIITDLDSALQIIKELV